MISKVISIRMLSESIYLLRIERHQFNFSAGQYLILGIPGEKKSREYSIYSPELADYLELLIKEVNPGELSQEFKYLKPGVRVEISGPFGNFTLDHDQTTKQKPVVFVATGTGISPFHSIILSNPSLDYQIIHGVRTEKEACETEHYQPSLFHLCVSREKTLTFHGRVTHFLKTRAINKQALYYLCGNSKMVDEVIEYLEEQGLPSEQIRTEIYF